MTLPFNLESAFLLVCEKVLMEAGDIPSAIRIVDAFYFKVHPDVPAERRTIKAALLGIIKVSTDDPVERALEVRVVTPDGKDIVVVPSHPIRLNRKIPDVVGGSTLNIDLEIVARASGTHVFRMILDNEEIARASITLIEER